MQADKLKTRIKDAVYKCFPGGRIDDYNDDGEVGRNNQRLNLQIVARISGPKLEPYDRLKLEQLIGATETVHDKGTTTMKGNGFELRLTAEPVTVGAV